MIEKGRFEMCMKLIKSTRRLVIVTDSLGCPREETVVDNTWTDKIIKEFSSGDIYFYTVCKHGQSFSNVPIEYILELDPDIVVIQIGVVDACRRVMGRWLGMLVAHIPIISSAVHKLAHRFHYSITKYVNIHMASKAVVRQKCLRLLNNTKAKFVFIAIAPASSIMNNTVYSFSPDVDDYNNVLKDLAELFSDRVRYINPYKEVKCTDDLFIKDGHHLSEYGISLVSRAVKGELNDLLGDFIR